MGIFTSGDNKEIFTSGDNEELLSENCQIKKEYIGN